MEQLIDVITQGAVAALSALLVAAVGFLLKFIGVKISESQQERLKAAAILAVGFAEEKAHQWLREQGTKLGGAVIEKVAIDRLIAMVPNVTEDEARAIILAVLPFARGGMNAGAASLGEAIRTPRPPAPEV